MKKIWLMTTLLVAWLLLTWCDCDVNVTSDGKIESLVVEKHRFILSYFSSKNEISIYWNQIDKIGEDVILVNIVY